MQDERLEGREIRQGRGTRFGDGEASPVDGDVGEVRLADAPVEAVDELLRVFVRTEVLGGAAAGVRHLVEEVAVHRLADAEREDARAPDLASREGEDLVLV